MSTHLDYNTDLCLACSASLPPLKSASSSTSKSEVFITSCCKRPICPSCTRSNPRLKRYDPCLACLGGVDVVSRKVVKGNVNGAARDEDMFAIGDDEDEDGEESPPPPYQESTRTAPAECTAQDAAGSNDKDPETQPESEIDGPRKYYIRKGDTLQGIALRFGVDGRELCQMNKLAISTLTTTPHLLHTRGFIILPVSAKSHPTGRLSREEEEERERKRIKERAEKRLQTMTKEVDWRVAKAYVALAEGEGEQEEWGRKRKEGELSGKGNTLEAMAVERYLDDEEWEARELREGRGVSGVHSS